MSNKLRLASCNVQHSRENISHLLETHRDFDIVLIQESFWGRIKTVPSTTNKHGDDYVNVVNHAQFIPIGGRNDSRVMFYINKRCAYLQPALRTDIIDHRDIAVLSLSQPTGNNPETIFIMNVYNEPKKFGALEYLTQHSVELASHNFVACAGDFNLHHPMWYGNSNATTWHMNKGSDLIESMSNLGLALANEPGKVTWVMHADHTNTQVLDLVWGDPNRISTFWVNLQSRYRGDHAVLTWEFDFLVNRMGDLTVTKDQFDDYVESLHDHLTSIIEDVTNTYNADRTSELINEAFMEAWHSCAQFPDYSKKSKSWWNHDCTLAAKALRAVRAMPRHHPQRKDLIDQHLKQLRAATRGAKRAYFDKIIEEASEGADFYKLAQWGKPQKQSAYNVIKDQGGNPVSDPDQLATIFATQYHPPLAPSGEVDIDELCGEPKSMRSFPHISRNELLSAISKCSNNSAPGPDHCGWKALKRLIHDPEIARFLCEFYQKCIDEAVFPRLLKKSISVVIPKPNRDDYSNPKNYRPIVLLNCVGKLLEKVVAARMQFDAQKWGILHPNQFGGTIMHSTTDAGIQLVQHVRAAWDQGIETTMLLFDVSQFFPSVRPDLLIRILQKQGFNDILCSWFRDYFSDRKTVFLIHGKHTSEITVEGGVGQGSSLSPILTNLYIAPILHKWAPIHQRQFGNTMIQFFVDDGAILVSHKDGLSVNNAIIQHIYEDIATDLNKIGLAVEAAKFELIHFRRGRQAWTPNSALGPDIVIRPKGIDAHMVVKPKTIVRYLGFFLDPKLSFKHHITHYANKASSSIHALTMLGNSCRGLAPTLRRRLYISNVLPIIAYGAALWWHPKWNRLKYALRTYEQAQSLAARWITGAFKTTPTGFLDMAAGLLPIRYQINKFMAQAGLRLRMLPENHPIRAWLPDHWAVNQQNIIAPFFSREGLPKSSPLHHMDISARRVSEQFNALHRINCPGDRLLDRFQPRIHFHLDAPSKGSDEFDKWWENTFLPKTKIIMNDPQNLILASDGSLRKKTHTAGAGFVVVNDNRHLIHRAYNCGHSQIFDAEIFAIAAGINFAVNHVPVQVHELHIFVDNKAAASSIGDTSLGPSQLLKIQIAINIERFLLEEELREVHIHWCPSHKGFILNEFADIEAKQGTKSDQVDFTSFSFTKSNITGRALQAWRHQIKSPRYRGMHNFVSHKTWTRTSHVIKKHPFLSIDGGNNNQLIAHVVRFTSGHSPIGEFRMRFPHIKGPITCFCGAPIETTRHIFEQCPLWIRRWDPQSRQREERQCLDPFPDIVWFLRANPMAASFEILGIRERWESIDFSNPSTEDLETINDLWDKVYHRRNLWNQYRHLPIEERLQKVNSFGVFSETT